jgi:hypothetical protein
MTRAIAITTPMRGCVNGWERAGADMNGQEATGGEYAGAFVAKTTVES